MTAHETHENHETVQPLLFRDECYAIMGVCFSVYKAMGCGFTEPVYQECMEIGLAEAGIPFDSQLSLPLAFRGIPLRHRFQPDLVCYNAIILELKAVSALAQEHRAQVLNYLHASGMKLGLLVNFGHYPKVEYERIVL